MLRVTLTLTCTIVCLAALSTVQAFSCVQDPGYDYDGYDIEPRLYFTLPTPEDCCQACLNDTQCKYFSFMPGCYPHCSGKENCWLKTSNKGRRPNNRISGTRPHVPTPPTPAPPPTVPPTPSPMSINQACENTNPALNKFPFCNTSLTIDQRVADLVGRLASKEKPALMTARHSAPIHSLGIPAYDWGVNSIHGIQTSCGTRCATNYPLPVAIGATFNMSLVQSLSRMMAVELRALRLEGACEKHRRRRLETMDDRLANETQSTVSETFGAAEDACIGLDTWAPNLNLNR